MQDHENAKGRKHEMGAERMNGGVAFRPSAYFVPSSFRAFVILPLCLSADLLSESIH
jgi:hypothetical protein